MIEGNQHGFFRNGERFFPYIQEGDGLNTPHNTHCNTICVQLPARPDSELNWTEQKKRAEELVEKGLLIFWQLDLGLEAGSLALKDTSLFFSFSIALEQFGKELWPSFKESTVGISLYRGSLNVAERLIWNAAIEEDFVEYLEKSPLTQDLAKQFFSVNLFAEFLHRLISYLPVEIAPFCQFDCSEIRSPALLACLAARNRFEFLHLALQGSSLPLRGLVWENGGSVGGWIGKGKQEMVKACGSQIGVVVPPDSLCSSRTLNLLDKILLNLQKSKTEFRLISELFLIEEWDGLETLVVIPEAVSPQGKRMLKGFQAAGGKLEEVKLSH